MLRRSILELSTRRRCFRSFPRQITSECILPLLCLSRNEFSTSSEQSASPKPGGDGKTPESNGSMGKVVAGSIIVAGATLLAYQSGYLDQFMGKEKPIRSAKVDANKEAKVIQPVPTNREEPPKFGHEEEQVAEEVDAILKDLRGVEVEEKVETHADLPYGETEQNAETIADLSHLDTKQLEPQTELPQHEAVSDTKGEDHSPVQDTSDLRKDNGKNVAVSQTTDAEGSLGLKNPELGTAGEPKEEVQVIQAKLVTEETEPKTVPPQPHVIKDRSEIALGKENEVASLLDEYLLKGSVQASTASNSEDQSLASAMEESNDGYVTNDGKLVMNFLQAIHAAEKRQAELDALAFKEEKRALKEKYEKELRDLRARELMRAEEAAMLDKEIKRERAKAAAAMRALEEKMEEKHRIEIEQLESEAETKMKKSEELAKAELAAAIASEKAAQIEKIAEANLNINALCMAFYAQSEETRQIHSVHKLALGALALEDALSKGLPIQQELDALNTYPDSIDKDSLLHLVLSTLPEETLSQGTDTSSQLNQKFNALKGTLQHYILIPPGGGGMLAHALARMASWLRMKEVNPSGDGIESIISRVESCLAEGKLAEAANALQEGVRGSQAEEIASDWVRRARNRAITEQALTVLQSYATSISLTQ